MTDDVIDVNNFLEKTEFYSFEPLDCKRKIQRN